MKPARFLTQLAVFALGIVALNVLDRCFLLPREVSQQLIRAIDRSPPVRDLFAGNSLMAAGMDPAAFERAAGGERRGLNVALGATSPVEHDVLLRRALPLGADRFWYGFYDTQLTTPPPTGFADLVGTRAVVHFLDRETAIRLLVPGERWQAWRIRLVARVPLVLNRITFWIKVELLRRRLAALGMAAPAAEVNRFGRAGDFTLLEETDEKKFARECAASASARAGFNLPVADMLSVARGHGMRFVFVEMPMPSTHRRRFYATPEWAAYAADLRAQARRQGADYLDASDWIADDRFADALHLNEQGAAEFSRRLGGSAPGL